MSTITISKTEYRRLKKHASAYRRITEEIVKAEEAYPYDYPYIARLMRETKSDVKKGRLIKAGSVDEALRKFRKK